MRDFWILVRMLVNCLYPLVLVFSMTRMKCTKKTSKLIFGGLLVFSVAVNTALYYIAGQEMMMRVFAIVILVPCVILLAILSKDRPSQLFFSIFTAINALYFVSILGRFMSGLNEEMIWVDAFGRAVLYSAILFVFYRYLDNAYHFLAENMQKGWGIISIIPFLFFCLVMFLGLYPTVRSDNLMAVLILYIILCFVYFVIYQVFRNTYELLLQRQAEQLLSMQLTIQKNQFDMQAQKLKDVRILRHDARHYLQSIATFLKEGNTDAALQFLEKFDDSLQQTSLVSYCENTILNTLIAASIDKACQYGIQVHTRLDIPEELPVDAVELSIVFSNAIENAIHACLALPEGQPREIKLVCTSKPNFLLEISNTYTGAILFDEKGYPVSAVTGHGIGTRSIEAFAKKYNAVLDYHTDHLWFYLRLLLNWDAKQRDTM